VLSRCRGSADVIVQGAETQVQRCRYGAGEKVQRWCRGGQRCRYGGVDILVLQRCRDEGALVPKALLRFSSSDCAG